MITILELLVNSVVIGHFLMSEQDFLIAFVQVANNLVPTFYRQREMSIDVAAQLIADTKLSSYYPREIGFSPITLYGVFVWDKENAGNYRLAGRDITSIAATWTHANALRRLGGLDDAFVLALPFHSVNVARQWIADSVQVMVSDVRIPTEYTVRVDEHGNPLSGPLTIDAFGSRKELDLEEYAMWSYDATPDIARLNMNEPNQRIFHYAPSTQ